MTADLRRSSDNLHRRRRRCFLAPLLVVARFLFIFVPCTWLSKLCHPATPTLTQIKSDSRSCNMKAGLRRIHTGRRGCTFHYQASMPKVGGVVFPVRLLGFSLLIRSRATAAHPQA